MSATKILWGQVFVVGLIALAFVWAATQWTAWRLGYQTQLGAPWFELRYGWPVYAPPAFFWWWFRFDAYAPRIFVEGAYIAASGGFIAAAAAIAMSVWRAREARVPALRRRSGALAAASGGRGRRGGARPCSGFATGCGA